MPVVYLLCFLTTTPGRVSMASPHLQRIKMIPETLFAPETCGNLLKLTKITMKLPSPPCVFDHLIGCTHLLSWLQCVSTRLHQPLETAGCEGESCLAKALSLLHGKRPLPQPSVFIVFQRANPFFTCSCFLSPKKKSFSSSTFKLDEHVKHGGED